MPFPPSHSAPLTHLLLSPTLFHFHFNPVQFFSPLLFYFPFSPFLFLCPFCLFSFLSTAYFSLHPHSIFLFFPTFSFSPFRFLYVPFPTSFVHLILYLFFLFSFPGRGGGKYGMLPVLQQWSVMLSCSSVIANRKHLIFPQLTSTSNRRKSVWSTYVRSTYVRSTHIYMHNRRLRQDNSCYPNIKQIN